MLTESDNQPNNNGQNFAFQTLEELYAMPEESNRFIVDNLLPSGGSSLLVGKPKAGKSILARQLASCVATGRPFLGRDVTQGEVLYLALEEKPQEIARHFKLLDVQNGIHTHCGSAPENPLRLLKEITAGMANLKLVIIDPIFRFIRLKDISSYTEVTAEMEKIMAFSQSHEAHLLAVHHLRKRESDDPRDGTLGSQALNGGVDSILSLQMGRETRILSTAQRVGTALPPTKLDWDADTRMMSVSESLEEESLRERRATANRISAQILFFLLQHDGATQEEINASVTGKNELRQSVLKELVANGTVTRSGSGQRGQPYLHSLAPIPLENGASSLAVAA